MGSPLTISSLRMYPPAGVSHFEKVVLRGWRPDSGRWGRFMKAVKLFSDPTKTKIYKRLALWAVCVYAYLGCAGKAHFLCVGSSAWITQDADLSTRQIYRHFYSKNNRFFSFFMKSNTVTYSLLVFWSIQYNDEHIKKSGVVNEFVFELERQKVEFDGCSPFISMANCMFLSEKMYFL